MLHNIVKSNSESAHYECVGENGRDLSTYEYFSKLAKELEEKTGNKHVITRVLDYTDRYEGRVREYYKFNLVEIIS